MTSNTSSPPSDEEIERIKKEEEIDEFLLRQLYEAGRREASIDDVEQGIDKAIIEIIKDMWHTKNGGNP